MAHVDRTEIKSGLKKCLRGTAPSILLLQSVFSFAANANETVIEESFGPAFEQDNNKAYGLRNGSFLAVPVPFSNPLLDSGLALGAGYLFQTSEASDTSYFAVGAMRSSNGSEAYGFSADLSFGSGWNFDTTLASANLNYDVFFGGTRFPLEQEGQFVEVGFDRDLGRNLSVGAGVRYLESTINLAAKDERVPDELLPDLTGEYLALSLRADRDTRNDSDYPTTGTNLSFELNLADVIEGIERSYTYAFANFDTFHSLSQRSVLATRLSACQASDETPFFDKCSIGFTDGFRGFTPTEFFDTNLVSTQIEYRQRLSGRFGFVVFGGIGWTGSSFSSLTDDGDRVAGGLGLRYRVSKDFPIDFSVDVSRNNQGDDFVYVYVGQSF